MSVINPDQNREVTTELDKPLPDIEFSYNSKLDINSKILSEPFPTEVIKHPKPVSPIEPEPELEEEEETTNLNIITFNDVAANFDTSQRIQPRETDPEYKKSPCEASNDFSRHSSSSLSDDNCTIFDFFGMLVKEVKAKGFSVVFRNDRLIEEEATQSATMIIYLVLGAIALILFIVGELIFTLFR